MHPQLFEKVDDCKIGNIATISDSEQQRCQSPLKSKQSNNKDKNIGGLIRKDMSKDEGSKKVSDCGSSLMCDVPVMVEDSDEDNPLANKRCMSESITRQLTRSADG